MQGPVVVKNPYETLPNTRVMPLQIIFAGVCRLISKGAFLSDFSSWDYAEYRQERWGLCNCDVGGDKPLLLDILGGLSVGGNVRLFGAPHEVRAGKIYEG